MLLLKNRERESDVIIFLETRRDDLGGPAAKSPNLIISAHLSYITACLEFCDI